MIRYTRQRCKTRCGPVALLNLAKWRGERVSYRRDIHRFEQACRWSREKGTPVPHMTVALGKPPRRISFAQFKRHLLAGGAILLHTDEPRDPEAHYHLAVGIDADGQYLLINYCERHMPCYTAPQYMAYLLRHSLVWTFAKRL